MKDALISSFFRPAKRCLTRVLRDTPLPSTVIGPPKAALTTQTWVEKYRSQNNESCASYTEVVAAENAERTPPFTVEEKVHWKFVALLKQSQPACFVANIPNGRVWGPHSAVITPDDCLLLDVSRASDVSNHPSLLRIRLGRLHTLAAQTATAATQWPDVYFHWMIDIIPRIHLLRLAGIEPEYLLINRQRTSFQAESIAALSLDRTKLLEVEDNWKFHLRSRYLIVPSLPCILDAPRRWICHFLRSTFQPRDSNRRKRLYVTRRTALGRRVENEADVLRYLTEKGFEVVDPSAMTIADQAALFASADVIVAPHGAALTNLTFCKPGTAAIDIFSPRYVNPCYWILSEEMRLRYGYLLGEGEQVPEGVDPDEKAANITVDLRKLAKLFTTAGV